MANGRKQGIVKWFNSTKGYGFITPHGKSEKDVFVHFSDIEAEGYRSLQEGDLVEFEVGSSEKGPKATGVRLVQQA